MSKKQTTLKVPEGEDFILITDGGAQISKEDVVVVTSLLTNAAVHIPAFGECIVAVAEMVKKICRRDGQEDTARLPERRHRRNHTLPQKHHS